MHIAMVTDYYLPTLGGVQTAIKAAKERLKQLGHQTTVYCPLHEPLQDPDVVGLPTSSVFNPDGFPFTWSPQAAIDALTMRLAQDRVDVVHVHSEMFAALAGIKAAHALGIPLVQTMHGRVDVYTAKVLPVPQLTTVLLAGLHKRHLPHVAIPADPSAPYMHTAVARRMWRLMINQANAADEVIVPSAHFAEKLVRQGMTAPVAVLSNGLEDSVLEYVGEPHVRKHTAGEPLQVMWCGRVSPEKRPDAFVRAVAAAGESVHASMYGDGLAMGKVRALISRLGVGHRVHLRGSVPQHEVLDAMAKHHVFVSSSYDFDNQPMVILEALATGLPIVVSDPDLTEGLPTGGFLVADSPSPQELGAVLARLAGSDSKVSEMSAAVCADDRSLAHGDHGAELLAVYERVTR